MLFTTLPTEIWLLIMQFLSTRDLVFVSLTCQRLKSIGGYEIERRQDINNLLSKYVADVDRFRSVLRTTKSFIIGDFVTAFFAGYDLPNWIEIVFDRDQIMTHLRSWFKFFREEDKILTNGNGLSIRSDVAGKFCDVQFADRQFILRFGHCIGELSQENPKPKSRMYKDPWGFNLCNYISWRDAVCPYPHFISGPSKGTGLTGNEELTPLYFRLENLRMLGPLPYKWTVNLPAIKIDIDDDGYDGSDEEVFRWYFETFFEELEEEEVDETELASYSYNFKFSNWFPLV